MKCRRSMSIFVASAMAASLLPAFPAVSYAAVTYSNDFSAYEVIEEYTFDSAPGESWSIGESATVADGVLAIKGTKGGAGPITTYTLPDINDGGVYDIIWNKVSTGSWFHVDLAKADGSTIKSMMIIQNAAGNNYNKSNQVSGISPQRVRIDTETGIWSAYTGGFEVSSGTSDPSDGYMLKFNSWDGTGTTHSLQDLMLTKAAEPKLEGWTLGDAADVEEGQLKIASSAGGAGPVTSFALPDINDGSVYEIKWDRSAASTASWFQVDLASADGTDIQSMMIIQNGAGNNYNKSNEISDASKHKLVIDTATGDWSAYAGELEVSSGTSDPANGYMLKFASWDGSSNYIDNFSLGEPVYEPEPTEAIIDEAYTFTEDFSNALDNSTASDKQAWDFRWQSGPVDYNGDTVQVIGADGWTSLEYYGSTLTKGGFTGQVDVCFDEGYGEAAIPTESCNLADIKFGSGNNGNARGAYFKYDAESNSITVLCQPEWGYDFYTGLEFGKWYTVRIEANLDIDLARVSIIDRESGAVIAEHETNFPDNVSYAYMQGLRNRITMVDNFVFACDPEPEYENTLHGYAPEDGVSHQNAAMKAYMADSYDSIASYAKGDAVRDYAVPVTFHWDAAEEGTVYTFEISENADMSEARAYETSRDYYDIYNLKLGTTYYWRALGSTNEAVSSFTTSSAAPRIMYASGVKNFRDLGGRTTADGKTVSQGKVYRSYCLDYYDSDTGEHEVYINDSGIDTMINELGIKSEIDLRSESSQKESVLGSGVSFYLRGMSYSGDIITGERSMIRSIFAIFANKDNYPIDFHCQIGTDRTGAIAYLLNGLLGVPKDELMRDYLFSNFCNVDQRLPEDIADKYVKTLDEYEGDTLQEKIYNWLNKEAGVTTAELDFIIAYLTGDEEAESPEFTYDVYQTFDDGNAAGWTGGAIENGAYKLTGNGKRVSYTLPDTIKSGKVESSVDLLFNNITGNGGDSVFLNMAWCESSVDQNPRKGWRFKYDNGNFDLQQHDNSWSVYDLNLPMDKWYTAISEIDLDEQIYTIRIRYKGSSEDLYSYSGVWNGEFGKLDMWVRVPDTDGYVLLDNFRISTGDEEQIPLPENANEIGLTESEGMLIANGYFDGAELTGKTYRVIFSEYNEDGKLIRVELSDAYTVTEGKNVFEYGIPMTENTENIYVFVWADGMIPICPAKGI